MRQKKQYQKAFYHLLKIAEENGEDSLWHYDPKSLAEELAEDEQFTEMLDRVIEEIIALQDTELEFW